MTNDIHPMLEKVARGMREDEFRFHGLDAPLGSLTPGSRWVPLARAAIQALMEPDEALIDVYLEHCDIGGDLMPAPDGFREGLYPVPRALIYVWQAMLASILEPTVPRDAA